MKGILWAVGIPAAVIREGSGGLKPGDLEPFKFDRDGALEKFDGDHEEFFCIVCFQDQTLDPLEGAVDDPGRFSDLRILELLHLDLRIDDAPDGVDLVFRDRNRFRTRRFPEDADNPEGFKNIDLDLIVQRGEFDKEVPRKHRDHDFLPPVFSLAPDLHLR